LTPVISSIMLTMTRFRVNKGDPKNRQGKLTDLDALDHDIR